MLDMKTTKKISCGKLKHFTFMLEDEHAVKGYVTCSLFAKNLKDAVLKVSTERNRNVDFEKDYVFED
mgnify:FL=1